MPRYFQLDGASKGHPRVSALDYGSAMPGVGSPVLNEAQAISLGIKLSPTLAAMAGVIATMVKPRVNHVSVALADGRILVIGGQIPFANDTTMQSTLSCEILDPVTGAWTTAPNFIYDARDGAAILLNNNKVLFAGGVGSGGTTLCKLYDPSLNTWAAGPAMAAARYNHTLTTLPDGRVMVIGDQNGTLPCQIYNPSTNTWATAASLPASKYNHGVVVLNDGRVLVAGGNSTASYVYTPAGDTWATLGATISQNLGKLVKLPDGSVLLHGNSSKNCQRFTPGADTWATAGAMNGQHAYGRPRSALVGGYVYLVPGEQNALPHQFERYDPASDSWSLIGPALSQSHPFGTLHVTAAGTLVCIGGQINESSSLVTGTVILFNPANSSVSLTPDVIPVFESTLSATWTVDWNPSPSQLIVNIHEWSDVALQWQCNGVDMTGETKQSFYKTTYNGWNVFSTGDVVRAKATTAAGITYSTNVAVTAQSTFWNAPATLSIPYTVIKAFGANNVPNNHLAIVVDGAHTRLAVTTNMMTSWAQVGPTGLDFLGGAVSRNGVCMAAFTATALYFSHDSGATWTNVTANISAGITAIKAVAFNSDANGIYLGVGYTISTGGKFAYCTDQLGTTWNVNSGTAIPTTINSIAGMDNAGSGPVYIGCDDDIYSSQSSSIGAVISGAGFGPGPWKVFGLPPNGCAAAIHLTTGQTGTIYYSINRNAFYQQLTSPAANPPSGGLASFAPTLSADIGAVVVNSQWIFVNLSAFGSNFNSTWYQSNPAKIDPASTIVAVTTAFVSPTYHLFAYTASGVVRHLSR